MDPLETELVPSPRRLPVRLAAADLQGVDARLVEIEAFVRSRSWGPPRVIGLGDTAVRESMERVRTSFSSLGLDFPQGQLVVNLAPARDRKAGTGFDLGIALAMACLTGAVPRRALHKLLVCAELGLDGTLRAVPGVLAMVELARRQGLSHFVCARDALALASRAAGDECQVLGFDSLGELLDYLLGKAAHRPLEPEELSGPVPKTPSKFGRIRGQESARQALELAAAGGHHLLMSGPPGCGKTLIASCLPELLPALNEEQRLEVLKIRSLFGEPRTREQYEILETGRPPFRAPHHTVSYAGLVGGGQPLHPGEITLAHRGVLFLDELPEFRRESLEALRQPLESGEIHVRRASAELHLPARFQLLAAMNPCPCGMLGHPTLPCRDSSLAIANYRRRISGPLLDRIDLQLQMQPVAVEELLDERGVDETRAQRARERILAARQRQQQRGCLNANIPEAQLSKLVPLSSSAERLLRQGARSWQLSARALGRVLRVARTLADLDGDERIAEEQIALALHFRVRPA
ncbi:MAG: hypothetical protein CSA62_03390 [Planctomycetota bacterium]|nr:MAG: hypothetical protein CSA62_03390 [Planctomycetota bacterium]